MFILDDIQDISVLLETIGDAIITIVDQLTQEPFHPSERKVRCKPCSVLPVRSSSLQAKSSKPLSPSPEQKFLLSSELSVSWRYILTEPLERRDKQWSFTFPLSFCGKPARTTTSSPGCSASCWPDRVPISSVFSLRKESEV